MHPENMITFSVKDFSQLYKKQNRDAYTIKNKTVGGALSMYKWADLPLWHQLNILRGLKSMQSK